MNQETKSPRRAPQNRLLLRIGGPLLVLLGIGLIGVSAIDFASTTGSEKSILSSRSLRSPKFGWFRWAGMALIGAGTVVSSLGFDLFAGRKEKSERPKAAKRKTAAKSENVAAKPGQPAARGLPPRRKKPDAL